ncbi:unnamed protein product [Schistosoma mattheei]|uniref:Uncharacterized protein n=1 Tax=Schistosoma mattheei TaxID=31246 RepID=A0A183P3I4_9TREM|nr:unnamed protein product [Schistosoma mattheei]
MLPTTDSNKDEKGSGPKEASSQGIDPYGNPEKDSRKEEQENSSRTGTEDASAQVEYIEANKQVKTSTRVDKQKYVEDLETISKNAATEKNIKQLYDTTKKLVVKYSKPERLRNGWVEHSEELLNKLAPLNPPDIEAPHTDCSMAITPPTIEEIEMVIRQISSGKAVLPDNIPRTNVDEDN